MGFEAEICFLADLRVLVAPIASSDPIPITAPELSGLSGFVSPQLQVPVDSETTHAGQVQINSNPITPTIERSEPELSGSDLLFFDSELTRMGCRQRCRDMSGLSLCLCGESVQPSDVGSIRCQRTGCETTWVSNGVDFTQAPG